MSVTVLCCNLSGMVGILCAPQSSCCYVIEQMDCSVSLLHKSFLAHTTQWWAENAQKRKKKTTLNASLIQIIIINRITLRAKHWPL